MMADSYSVSSGARDGVPASTGRLGNALPRWKGNRNRVALPAELSFWRGRVVKGFVHVRTASGPGINATRDALLTESCSEGTAFRRPSGVPAGLRRRRGRGSTSTASVGGFEAERGVAVATGACGWRTEARRHTEFPQGPAVGDTAVRTQCGGCLTTVISCVGRRDDGRRVLGASVGSGAPSSVEDALPRGLQPQSSDPCPTADGAIVGGTGSRPKAALADPAMRRRVRGRWFESPQLQSVTA